MPFLPFIPFASCAEVIMKFIEGSMPWYLTLGFKAPGAVGLTEINDLETAIDAWWTTDLSPRISTATLLSSIKVVGLTTQFDPFVDLPPATQAGGTLVGAATPLSNAMVVTLQTALRGRSYRGRNFVAGRVAPEVANENTWTTIAVLAMQGVYNALPAIVAAHGWTHVVLSRNLNSVRRTVGAATPVTAYVVKGQIATQRKRLLA